MTKPGVLATALRGGSSLVSHLKPGLRAMAGYSNRVDESARKATDSIDADNATEPDSPDDPRWDFFIGTRAVTGGASEAIVAIEVHPAKDSEVKVVIAKKTFQRVRMVTELRTGTTISRWIWIASGRTRFSPNSKYRRLLAAERIEFAGTSVKL